MRYNHVGRPADYEMTTTHHHSVGPGKTDFQDVPSGCLLGGGESEHKVLDQGHEGDPLGGREVKNF